MKRAPSTDVKQPVVPFPPPTPQRSVVIVLDDDSPKNNSLEKGQKCFGPSDLPGQPPKRSSVAEMKALVAQAPQRPLLENRRTGTGSRSKLNMMSTVLWSRFSSTSSAGAALASATALTPSASSEYTAFAGLYDEVRVKAVSVHFTTTQTGTVVNFANYAVMGYDPVDATIYASVLAAMPTSQHVMWALPSPPSVYLSAPVYQTKNGFQNWHCTVPKGTTRDSALSTVFGGSDWSTTLSGSSPVYGYLKWYIDALGGTATTNLSGLIQYHVEFRSRV